MSVLESKQSIRSFELLQLLAALLLPLFDFPLVIVADRLLLSVFSLKLLQKLPSLLFLQSDFL